MAAGVEAVVKGLLLLDRVADGGSVGAATVVAVERAATADGHAAEVVGASRRAVRPSVSRSTERERPCMSSAVMYLEG